MRQNIPAVLKYRQQRYIIQQILRTENKMGNSAERIRNIALIGHGGEGKTSLAEAMLFNMKAIDRLGKVTDGNTCMDFDPEEISKKISISLAVANGTYKGVKINILDVPGFFDFEGEMVQALAVADVAVVVTGAGGSLTVGTEKALDYCEENKIPAVIFVNGMDKENVDYAATVASIREKYGAKVVPVWAPVLNGEKFVGYANVDDNKAFDLDGKEIALPSEVADMRATLSEEAASQDEELMMKFLEGEALAPEEMANGIKAGIKSLGLIPVYGGSAFTNKGITNFMDKIVSEFPSPADCFECKSDAPVVLRVFKTIVDPFVGRLNMFKVLSGTLKTGMTLANVTKDASEKISAIYFLKGKKQEATDSVECGDLGALAKLNNVTTGDTLREDGGEALPEIKMPLPVYSMAIYASKKGEEDKIFAGLNRLMDEDISFTVTKNVETGEMLLSGIGETQLNILCKKLKNKFGCEAVLKEPKIAYRETIKKRSEAEGKHKKQSGGAGQFGQCSVRFEPGAEDGVYEFVDAVVGGAVPKQFIPAVDKGLREAVKEGVLAGYPMVNLKCTLFDGKYHPVDSKEIAFVTAAKLAYQDGIPKASPVILEPIMKVEIVVPENYMGDIMGDMNKRRGRILGTEHVNGKTVVTAEAPQSELSKYATDLRSMTQGRGRFTVSFERYEEVPPMAQDKIIKEAKEAKEG